MKQAIILPTSSVILICKKICMTFKKRRVGNPCVRFAVGCMCHPTILQKLAGSAKRVSGDYSRNTIEMGLPYMPDCSFPDHPWKCSKGKSTKADLVVA